MIMDAADEAKLFVNGDQTPEDSIVSTERSNALTVPIDGYEETDEIYKSASSDISVQNINIDLYEGAVKKLEQLFIKRKNTEYARYILLSRKQSAQESTEAFAASIQQLSRDCQLHAVTEEEYTQELLLSAFVLGLRDDSLRQKLFQTPAELLTFESALEQARVHQVLKRQKQEEDDDEKMYASVTETATANAGACGVKDRTADDIREEAERLLQSSGRFLFLFLLVCFLIVFAIELVFIPIQYRGDSEFKFVIEG